MDENNTLNIHQSSLFNNLRIILQAIKCYLNNGDCTHSTCPQFRDIFLHIGNCDNAEKCALPKCITTVKYMTHYLSCVQSTCHCFKFGIKSAENKLFVQVKNILLRNQFMIWRRKMIPFRSYIIWKISDQLANSDEVNKDVIFNHLSKFDDQNFQKSKGISTYLTNFSQTANNILTKVQIQHIQKNEPTLSYQQCLEKVDIDGNLKKLYNYLKRYSTDVLHDKMRLETNGEVTPGNIVNPLENAITIKKPIKIEEIANNEPNSESPTNSSSLTPPKSVSSLKSSPSVKSEKIIKNEKIVKSEKIEKNEKIWSSVEIKDLFMPVHKKICAEKDSEIFLKPVDWKLLEIPDYPKIITHPMDLSTIQSKLTNGDYTDPWAAIGDYWLMFNNAWTYNKKSSRVYKMCSNVAKTFETLADEMMRSIGLCCGREYVFLPQVLICCTPQMCMVNRDAVYYSMNNEDRADGSRQVPALGSDKYVCCEKCFNENDSQSIEMMVSESASTLVPVDKSLFTKLKNNVKEKEEFVQCKACHKKWHKVCAEHIDEIWASGFYCSSCESTRPFPKQKNMLISSNLPHCSLSRHLEACIDAWRQKQNDLVSKVVIRVLSISKKNTEIKPEMRRIFVENGEMPEHLPYKLKAIFAFQEQPDGTEVCLFGMHTQEYGSDCPEPNARRVYLAYLDSVNFFEPHNLRTDFYHRFLISYMEYCHQIGFVFAHIWACPPGDGDDYIFHMHPPTQKVPKPKRLQEWYIAMLDKAVKEGVVIDYSDIFTYSYNSQLMSVSEVPYFEGDYWPTVIEDLLKEDLPTHTDAVLALGDDDSAVTELQEYTETSNSKKRKLKKIQNNTKRRRQSDLIDGSNDIMKRLFDLMERRKENFFVVRLHSQIEVSSLPEIEDKDTIGFSDLMDGRDKFLSLSREKHLEFSTIRRAKFATLVLCYELHLELRHGVIYSCNSCDVLLEEVRFTCQVCEEYELCESCVSKQVHEHKLKRIPSLESETGTMTSASNGSSQPTESNKVTEEQKLLMAAAMYEHAYKCRDANCRQQKCNNWKRFVNHFKECTQNNRNCDNCYRLDRIIKVHSKNCRNPNCTISLCQKKQRHDTQTRLYSKASARRRMESAASVPMSVVVPIHQPPNLMSSIQPDPAIYTNDILTIRNFINHWRVQNLSEVEISKALDDLLNSNPQLKNAWRYHSLQMRRQESLIQQANVTRYPQNSNMYPPSQLYIQQQHPPLHPQQQNLQQQNLQQQNLQQQHLPQQHPPQQLPSQQHPQQQLLQQQHPQQQQIYRQQINPQQQLLQQQQQHPQQQQIYRQQINPQQQPQQAPCYIFQPGLNQTHQVIYPPNSNQFQQQQHSTLINNTQFNNFNPS